IHGHDRRAINGWAAIITAGARDTSSAGNMCGTQLPQSGALKHRLLETALPMGPSLPAGGAGYIRWYLLDQDYQRKMMIILITLFVHCRALGRPQIQIPIWC